MGRSAPKMVLTIAVQSPPHLIHRNEIKVYQIVHIAQRACNRFGLWFRAGPSPKIGRTSNVQSGAIPAARLPLFACRIPATTFRACRRCLRCERNSPADCPEFHECLNLADQDVLQQRVRRSGRSSHRRFRECAPSILSDAPDREGPKNFRCLPEAEPPVILLRVLRGNTYLADLRDWRSAYLYAAMPAMSREFTVVISSALSINTVLRKRFSGP